MKYGALTLGQVEAIINKLGGMDGVKRFLSSQPEAVVRTHIINCDVDPFVPKGWKVEEHIKGGELEWDPNKIQLYLSLNQQRSGHYVEGHRLREELKSQSVLNANVLDYLLKNPHFIPEEWKGKTVFFWGTIYRHSNGNLCVRCLYWRGDDWGWSCYWLDYDWDSDNPAATAGTASAT